VRGSETVEVVRVGKEVRRQWVLICSWTHGQRPTLPGGSAWYTSAGSDGVISEAVQGDERLRAVWWCEHDNRSV
jgi:hypothetical protein